MQEDILLEETIEVLESGGYESAYNYLMLNKNRLSDKNDYPTLYYYLGCLAAGSGKNEEALKWLDEAIVDKGYWYRNEMLDDDDLEHLFTTPEFQNLRNLSAKRFKEFESIAIPKCTWKEKEKESILLALHGNGENAKISRETWKQLERPELQVEAVQSSQVHSFERFRWHYDEKNYIEAVDWVKIIGWADYKHQYLCGFSAGCDMILRIITKTEVTCDSILLQSPWIPYIEACLDEVIGAIKQKNIVVNLYVGSQDAECLDMSNRLYNALQNAGVKSHIEVQTGLRHCFPSELGDSYKNKFNL